MSIGGLVEAVEDLYASVVTDPARWNDAAFADWAEQVAEHPVMNRELARAVRRCVRVAERLAGFWRDPPPGVPVDGGDWRTRVDIALGVRAWRPTLELARGVLAATPTPELYEFVKARFRLVTSQAWMDGVDYEAWRAIESDRGR